VKFHRIQELRALAAALVVVDHTLTFLTGPVIPIDTLMPTAWFIGEQGVAVFFVISGFIMAVTTRNVAPGPSRAANFLLHRIIRVAPPYWLLTLVAAALIWAGLWQKGSVLPPVDVLKSLAFIPYGHPGNAMRPVLGQGWTLNYEILFYLIFSLGLLFARGPRSWLICLPLAGAAAFGLADKVGWNGQDPVDTQHFYSSPLLLLFVVGIALGNSPRQWRLPAVLARHTLTIALAGTLLATIIFKGLIDSYTIPFPYRIWFWMFDAALVWLAASCPPDERPGKGAGEYLGDASYSIYLVHFFVLTALARVWNSLLHWHAWPLFLLVAPLFGIASGLAFHQLIERPMTQWLRQRLTREQSNRFSDAAPRQPNA